MNHLIHHRSHLRGLCLTLVALGASAFAAGTEAPVGYYRQPAIHGDTIVFVSEGDLWKVSTEGGVASRLTTHHGLEQNPAISPDGAVIAFNAQYEGPNEVYTMPLESGLPTRHTYHGFRLAVRGFTPDGDLLYSTRRYSTLPNYQLVRQDRESGESELIPLAQAAEGSFDDAGAALFFTRLNFQGSHTKRYKGGTAQNLWRFDLGADAEAVPLTGDYAGTSKNPMFWSRRVYFLSDRDDTMNIWSMRPDGSDLRQHTRHIGWDIMSASLHDGRIVYQLGADLRLYDIRQEIDRVVAIQLDSDFDQTREKWITEPMGYLTSAHIAPDGEGVVLTARGEVFVAPAKQGRLVHVTRRPDVRYRDARFMPGGDRLLTLSDESGEVELWTLPSNGVGDASQLTDDGEVLRFDATPSPDGQWIAYADKNWRLWLYDVSERSSIQIDESGYAPLRELTWSPDGRWLAYVTEHPSEYGQIRLFSVEDRSITDVTTDRFHSYSPAWDPNGEWLYFLSERELVSLVRSPWGRRQPEPFFDRAARLYAIALRPGLRSPFEPDNELIEKEEETEDKDEDEGEDKDKRDAPAMVGEPVEIEPDGIPARLFDVPVERGNYSNLFVTEDRLFWVAVDDLHERKADLKFMKITNEDPEPKTLIPDIRSAELSLDRKKILVRKNDTLYIIDASADAGVSLEDAKVNLDAWSFPLIPREEWRQMFVEAWRLERDYFYDRNLHGVDWPAMLEKYRPLVDRVRDRAELSDLIAQMVSELSALHIYVYGGDFREGEEEIEPASLGARLRRDPAAGGYRVEHIYECDPDEPGRRSPLAKPGVDVEEGDLITMVNGVRPLEAPDLGALLRNQAGRQTLLEITSGTTGEKRLVIVEPISQWSASDLRYDEWESTRRQLVDELSDGKIGYIHLRAMGSGDIAQWARDFYPVFTRPGLIIDVRHNGGGNIDSWILEKLMRRAWFYWQGRVGEPTWNMQQAFRGHLVALCDQNTGSDGEAFVEGFRRLGLGKLFGTRTWGGEIWLTSSNFLVDEGIATAAEFGVYGPEGEWLIEGHGVEPDVVVDNLPHATFNGEDAQLKAAIEHLLEQIEQDPRTVPRPPTFPRKTSEDNAADDDG